MTNIENKVDGVRLSPEDLGGERQFSIVLEALREVHDKRKKSLSQYIQDLHDEYARKFNVPVRSKLALLYSAKSVLAFREKFLTVVMPSEKL